MRSCRQCGCTDERPCPGGCFWVEEDLCSACAEIPEAELDDASADEMPCPASPIPAPHTIIWTSETTGHCVRCRGEFRA